MILSTHVSEIARAAVSFSGVILNNSGSSRMYFYASVSTLLITNLEEGSLFCNRYKYSLFCNRYKYARRLFSLKQN